MNRLVRSRGYARARLISAALFIVLGAAVAYRTVLAAGPSTAAVPGFVLGAAMIGLGFLRIRAAMTAPR